MTFAIAIVTRRNYPPIPQEGDTFQEFTTRENYPLPLTKNKVNHINKIIMTKLSLMHPCLFSIKKSFCAKNLIQLINSNRFTTTCLILIKIVLRFHFFFFRSFLKLTLSLINNVFIICFQVTEFNWISLQAGLSHYSQLSIFQLLCFSVLSLTLN